MKKTFLTFLATVATLFSVYTAQAQSQVPVIGVYGRESVSAGFLEVTLIKPDTMKVTSIQLVSPKHKFSFKPKGWFDPAGNSEKEELVFQVERDHVNFDGPVVLHMLRGKKIIRTYELYQRSLYGADYLDFYRESI